ncbi:MAG: TIGR03013 family XrtA/PEP-CTERM system glycosyltransferase [Pseudomonadota bacterium]
MTIRIFDHHVHIAVLLLAAAEFAVCVLAIAGGHWLADSIDAHWAHNDNHFSIWCAALSAFVISLALAAMGLYRLALRATMTGIAARVIVAVVLTGLFLPFVYYFIPSLYLHPLVMTFSAALLIVGILIVRYGFSKVVDENFFKRRVLVIGAGKRAEQFLTLRRQADQRGFKLVRYISMEGDSGSGALPEKRVRPMPESLYDYASKHKVDEIVIAMDDRRGKLPVRQLLECRLQSIDVTDVVSFLERETGKINLSLVSPSWLIFESGFRRKFGRRVAQRIFDLVASLLVLIPASPVMLVAAILIKLEDGGPVFYRQRRVGRNNVNFNVLKFRSMRVDAEKPGQAVWAKKDDDRVTKVGGVFRKTRIDELPQLLNVLAGTMSIVGPRPERPEFVEQLSEELPYYLERHRVRPGITGWAQMSYPYGSSSKDAFEKLQYDLYYVKNRTILLDVMILLQTAEVVLWQKGSR